MNYSLLIFFLIISISGSTQPDPRDVYPAQIKSITEKLKTDSLNYNLIWERLEMKINLMGGFPPSYEIFSFKIDSNKTRRRELYFDEFSKDFTIIYDSVIRVNNFYFIEEGDFYLNRIRFYYNMLEFDKAIKDAKFLRDFASYSKFSERGEYYNNWALYSLFYLNIVTNQYESALNAVNTLLEKKKIKDPKIYFSGHGDFLSYRDKIQLFENFDKKDQIIPYLKQTCRENFDWYFEKAKQKDADYNSWSLVDNEYYTSKQSYLYFMGCAKEASFQLLKTLMFYMRKYQDKELLKFDRAYNYIRFQMNENYETINPSIDDEELKVIISKILE